MTASLHALQGFSPSCLQIFQLWLEDWMGKGVGTAGISSHNPEENYGQKQLENESEADGY